MNEYVICRIRLLTAWLVLFDFFYFIEIFLGGKIMKIQLSDHFDAKRLFKFVLPSVVMMVFTSVYGVVDGFFVSNFVGKIPFAAVNLIIPVTQILGSVGFMFGTGGSAIVAKTFGEGKEDKAKRIFSMLVYIAVIIGILLAVIGIVFIEPIAVFLGAEGDVVGYASVYARIVLCSLPAFMLQNMFQSFFVTAEKPHLGLGVTVAAGVTNMVLDALFMAVFKWGVAGAAAATSISIFVGGVVPVVYFSRKNSSTLRFVKSGIDVKTLLHTAVNGSSEFVASISLSVVAMLYNVQLLKYIGENGVAAYGVIMYVSFIFIAIFLGYSIGIAPIVGYNQGSGNDKELKNVFRKSMTFVTILGLFITVISFFCSGTFSKIFVGYDKELFEITSHAFRIYGFSFLFCGFSIFGSGFFTALNNGIISGVISFVRTLVCQILAVIILPIFFGVEGIWCSVVVAEGVAAVISLTFVFALRKKYKY